MSLLDCLIIWSVLMIGHLIGINFFPEDKFEMLWFLLFNSAITIFSCYLFIKFLKDPPNSLK